MKPKQAFGVAVRVVALIIMIAGAYFLICGLVLAIDPSYSTKLAPAWHYLLFGGVELVLGLLLIRRASCIVKFAYSHEEEDSEGATKADI